MFTGDLLALSNFDVTPFFVPSLGITVKSNEHLFNAYKTLDPVERQRVLDAGTPGQAKGIGRRVTLRPGWDEGVRVRAMQTGLLAKSAVPELRAVLDSTGTMRLVETNRWHDGTWGRMYWWRAYAVQTGLCVARQEHARRTVDGVEVQGALIGRQSKLSSTGSLAPLHPQLGRVKVCLNQSPASKVHLVPVKELT